MFTTGNQLQCRLSTIRWTTGHALWLSVILFSQLSLYSSNGLMNEVAIVAQMEDVHGLNNMNFPLSRATLDTTIAGCSIFPQKRSTWVCNMAPFSGWTRHLPDGRLISLYLFYHVRGRKNSSFMESNHLLDMDLLSLPVMLLFHTTVCVFTECLTHHYGILPRIASSRRTHFKTKETQQWAHCYGINWFCHIRHHLEMDGYFLKWKGLLKAQVWCQLRDTPVFWQYVLWCRHYYIVLFPLLLEYMGPVIKVWK